MLLPRLRSDLALSSCLLALAACAPPEEGDEASEPTPADCAEAELRNELGLCVPASCGTAAWPEAPTEGAFVHLAPGGDGDGSADAPFGDLQAAIDAVQEDGGGTVLLSTGVHVGGAVVLPRTPAVSLLGGCAEGAVLLRDEGWGLQVGGDLALRGVTLRGGSGILVRHGGLGFPVPTLDLQDVLIEDTREAGLLVFGPATVGARDSAILRTTPRADDYGGWGMALTGRTTATLSGLRIEGGATGVFIQDEGTSVLVEDSTIRGVRDGGTDLAQGAGVDVRKDSEAVVRGTRIEDCLDGVSVLNGASALVVESELVDNLRMGASVVGDSLLTVEDTTAQGNLVGLHADQGTAVFERVRSSVNRSNGVQVTNSAHVTLRDSEVSGNGTDPATGGGSALIMSASGVLEAADVLMEDNWNAGLMASDGSVATLERVQILRTRPYDVLHCSGVGLQAASGGRLVATDVVVEDSACFGFNLMGEGTTAELTDVVVRGTEPHPLTIFGRGVNVSGRASLVGRGLLVDDNHEIGVLAEHRASVELFGSTIRGTRDSFDTVSGIGVVAQLNANVLLEDVVVEDNEGVGAYIVGSGLMTRRADFLRNHFAGILTWNSTLWARWGRIAETRQHPSEGGGVGIFGTCGVGGFCQTAAQEVTFEDLRGPAMYLVERDPSPDRTYSDWVMSKCTVRRSGGFPLPGGVFFTGGSKRWVEAQGGFGVLASHFEDLPYDAVLVDGATVSLRALGELGNTFENIGGESVYVQRCGDAEESEVIDDSGGEADCREVPRMVGPVLQYQIFLTETQAVE